MIRSRPAPTAASRSTIAASAASAVKLRRRAARSSGATRRAAAPVTSARSTPRRRTCAAPGDGRRRRAAQGRLRARSPPSPRSSIRSSDRVVISAARARERIAGKRRAGSTPTSSWSASSRRCSPRSTAASKETDTFRFRDDVDGLPRSRSLTVPALRTRGTLRARRRRNVIDARSLARALVRRGASAWTIVERDQHIAVVDAELTPHRAAHAVAADRPRRHAGRPRHRPRAPRCHRGLRRCHAQQAVALATPAWARRGARRRRPHRRASISRTARYAIDRRREARAAASRRRVRDRHGDARAGLGDDARRLSTSWPATLVASSARHLTRTAASR